jgi:hypothetical protein
MSPTTTVAEFAVRPNPDPHSDEARQRYLKELDFGQALTDHMVRISWAEDEGWTDRRVEPYGPITLAEVSEGAEDGEIAELFACGTAALVAPVGRLASLDFDVTIGAGAAGAVTMRILERLTDIQYGRAEDVHGWKRRVG